MKKTYFMTKEIDLVGEKQPFLTNTSFLIKNKGNVNTTKTTHCKTKMPKT